MGGGVLAREEQRHRVAEDLLVVEAPVARLRGKHRLEEVRRLLAALRMLVELPSRLVDELLDGDLERRKRPLQPAVGRELDPVPVGDRQEDPAAEHFEGELDVPLQLVLAALEGVDVDPEGEGRGDVHGVGGQLPLDLDRLSLAGGGLQPPPQPLGGGADDVEVGVEAVGVERGHREAALASPVLSLDGEDAVEAQFPEDRLDLALAPEALRPLAQERVGGLPVGDDDDTCGGRRGRCRASRSARTTARATRCTSCRRKLCRLPSSGSPRGPGRSRISRLAGILSLPRCRTLPGRLAEIYGQVAKLRGFLG